MASAATSQLAAMTLADTARITHGPCANATAWKEELDKQTGLPNYALTKTLVLKPSADPQCAPPPD